MTMFLGTKEVTFTNAGHNPLYMKREDGNLEHLDENHGLNIGVRPNISYEKSRLELIKSPVN